MAETTKTIDRGTLIPLGLTGAIVVLVTGLWTAVLVDKLGTRLGADLMALRFSVENVEQSQANLRVELQRIAEDGVSDTEWELWIERYRARNPTADVPDRPK